MKRSIAPLIGILLLTGMAAWYELPLFAENDDQTVQRDESSSKFAAKDLEFFEHKIRPILVKHCIECHSDAAAKVNHLKGGLRVDSRDGLRRGGDSGPAVVPKNGDQSLLLEALRYQSLQMPPQGKLPANVIADFEEWIARGAADPRMEMSNLVTPKAIDLVKGGQHWSYQPLRPTVVPQADGLPWKPQSVLDAFVLARLEAEKMIPAEEAERIVLVRRIYFDLVGLPPSPEDVDEFLTDHAPDAFERLVDRLLASPQFGARWGRHWLSVVRFGESLTLRGFILPEAWRYRDYVIDSFNADVPFDRFIVEQVAGDLLPAETVGDQQRQRIATTFLTLGNLNLEEQDKQQLRMDVVDEQLDVIAKGFLAQTVTCARCHDHKFDPIPTRDYYALAGILANVKTLEHANVSKWLEFPLPLEPEQESILKDHEAATAALREKINAIQLAEKKSMVKAVVAANDLPGVVVDDRQAKVVGDWQQSQSVKPYIGDGYLHDKNSGKGDKTITLLPELPKAGRYEVRLAYTADDNRSTAVPVTIMSADGEKTVMINQQRRPPIDDRFVSLGQFSFELNGQGFVMVSTAGTTGHVIVDAVQFLPAESLATDAQIDKPVPALANSEQSSTTLQTHELQKLQRELKQLQKTGPQRPRYMSVQEESQIGDIRVHIRGSVHSLGENVPRGFLQVVAIGERSLLPTSQSGRKELGEWITQRNNPLTPRVLANRVWTWLFGFGLSRTPDNFGTTGEPPTHPELLDRLADRLLEHNWSLKPLIREIVQSHTYRQSSFTTTEGELTDPENRWLSHQNRRRLDAECLLDAILTVSDQRIDEFGGNTIIGAPADDYGYVQRSRRRAIYWPVLRNSLPEIFEAFDFADPSLPSGSRTVSTVALQSLFFLNSDWIAKESQSAARRILSESPTNDAVRLERVFRLALSRPPNINEVRVGTQVLSGDLPPDEAWATVVRALFASIDFRYVE